MTNRMTREEAIKAIEWYMVYIRDDFGLAPMPWFVAKALDMAIEALQIDIVYCYECKYDGSCCQCVDIIDDLLSLNFCGRGERKEAEE